MTISRVTDTTPGDHWQADRSPGVTMSAAESRVRHGADVQLHSPAMADPPCATRPPRPCAPVTDSRRPGSTGSVDPPAVDADPDRQGDSDGRDVDRRPVDRARTDRRRLVAAIASSVLPGAGQALNGRLRPALLFGVPTLVVAR